MGKADDGDDTHADSLNEHCQTHCRIEGAGGETHNVPVKKTPARATFCFKGSCSLRNSGKGTNKMRKSLRTLIPALVTASNFLLKQWPFVLGSHDFDTGVQVLKCATTEAK